MAPPSAANGSPPMSFTAQTGRSSSNLLPQRGFIEADSRRACSLSERPRLGAELFHGSTGKGCDSIILPKIDAKTRTDPVVKRLLCIPTVARSLLGERRAFQPIPCA
jgi:hypothetical protein